MGSGGNCCGVDVGGMLLILLLGCCGHCTGLFCALCG